MEVCKSHKLAALVVEDEPLLLMDLVDMIEEAGFKAFTARNADAALTVFETHSDIKILFTDIDMPGSMDGLELANLVRKRRPDTFIIIASGVVDLDENMLPDRAIFISKPYSSCQIISALRDIPRFS